MSSDEQLMLEFQQGSKDAFLELFTRYREPMFGFFRRRLQDAARAEELAQETFLVVLKGIARYEPRALVKTYLYGIATLLHYGPTLLFWAALLFWPARLVWRRLRT